MAVLLAACRWSEQIRTTRAKATQRYRRWVGNCHRGHRVLYAPLRKAEHASAPRGPYVRGVTGRSDIDRPDTSASTNLSIDQIYDRQCQDADRGLGLRGLVLREQSPQPDLTEDLGEMEIKAESLRYIVCAGQDSLAD